MFCKEYLCSCNARLRFDFKECSGDDTPIYAKLPSTITLVMTKKLMLSIRSSRYLIFLMFHCLSRFLVETKMNPFIFLQKKAQLKGILSLKWLQVLCSQYFQVLEICLSIAHIQKPLLNFLKDHFGIVLHVML